MGLNFTRAASVLSIGSHLQRGIDPSPFEGFIPPFGRLDLDQYDNGADWTARHDCRPLPRQSLRPRLSVHDVGTRIYCEKLKCSPIPNPNPKPQPPIQSESHEVFLDNATNFTTQAATSEAMETCINWWRTCQLPLGGIGSVLFTYRVS